MKMHCLFIIMVVTLGFSATAGASEPCSLLCSPPALLCEVPPTTWLCYTTPREHDKKRDDHKRHEEKRHEEQAKKPPCSTSHCCNDARTTIRIELARPCYNEQGLKAFAALFSAAAERGVENASIRALNRIEVESGGNAKK